MVDKARFMDNRIEGYIDDVKIVDGVLSPLPDIMRTGRFARCVFETCAESDNVKATELVRAKRPAEQVVCPWSSVCLGVGLTRSWVGVEPTVRKAPLGSCRTDAAGPQTPKCR